MTPTDNSHTPHGGLPHLVSACAHCQEVMGLPEDYATGDALVCPVCEKPLAPEEIKPRTLRVAFHSELPEPTAPPARPTPELPTSDSLKEWLDQSSSQMGFSDSVLDPTPSEHARDDDTEVESSLSGIELGTIFPTDKLASEEESSEVPRKIEEAASSYEEPSEGVSKVESLLEDSSQREEPQETSQDKDDDPPTFAPTFDESSSPENLTSEETIAPLFEDQEQEEARQDSDADSNIIEQESEGLGADMTAQLLQAGSSESSGNKYLLPIVTGLLFVIGAPLGYLLYTMTSGDDAAGKVIAKQSFAAPSADSPQKALEEDPTEPADDPSEDAASEVSQASYEQPLPHEISKKDSSLVGDRYAESQPVQIRLLGAPTYRYQDLFDATTKARSSGRAFTRGSLDDPSSVEDLGKHYAHLCYLAQVITLIDPDEDHSDLQMAKLEAVDVFKRVLRTERMRETATEIAGSWLEWTGRPHGGVFFVGIPTVASAAGDVYEYQFDVSGSKVSVLTQEPISVRRFAVNTMARTVGIIGVVVEDPAAHVPGYTGKASRAVWVQKTLALADPNTF